MNVLEFEGRDSLRSCGIIQASRALTKSDQAILLCQYPSVFSGKHVGDEVIAREYLKKAYDVGISFGSSAECVLLSSCELVY